MEPGSAGGTLIIQPLKPLVASSGATNIGYLVLLTNGIHSTAGTAAVPDADYQTVRDQAISEIQAGASTPTCTPITNASLNAICRLTFAHLRIGGLVGVDPASVVVSFSFSTQSTGDTLAILARADRSVACKSHRSAIAARHRADRSSHNQGCVISAPGNRGYLCWNRAQFLITCPHRAVAPTAPVTRFWTAAGPPRGTDARSDQPQSNALQSAARQDHRPRYSNLHHCTQSRHQAGDRVASGDFSARLDAQSRGRGSHCRRVRSGRFRSGFDRPATARYYADELRSRCSAKRVTN